MNVLSQARNIISDFGMFFATILMVGLSVLLRDRVTVESIQISKNGYDPTVPTARGWIISPLGIHSELSIWGVMGAILPATLVGEFFAIFCLPCCCVRHPY